MKKADPIAFGARVRDLRQARGFSQERLAKLSGYSQTNIGWVESGKSKKPHVQAMALAEALRTSHEWLLWGTGRRDIGPNIMSGEEVLRNYDLLSDEQRAAISEAMSHFLESTEENRNLG